MVVFGVAEQTLQKIVDDNGCCLCESAGSHVLAVYSDSPRVFVFLDGIVYQFGHHALIEYCLNCLQVQYLIQLAYES